MKKYLKQSQSLKNQKGQVAIFVALIFQVLFIFFAMIVNVGLLVHHKINLQNSVDLAAYYGAMKQAEMLNAISHVNYQIRQSFKLLTFRYQQLGTAGLAASPQNIHPFISSDPSRIREEQDEPFTLDTAFCLPYTPFDFVKGTESYCKEQQQLKVPPLGVPGGSKHPITAIEKVLIDFANTANAQMANFCEASMATNWLQLAKFIAAYKYDIRNRKMLLLSLANEISKAEPRDIQGDSIKLGVFKTLLKNLSGPNQDSLKSAFDESTGNGNKTAEADFKFFNSLSEGPCAGNSIDSMIPPGWLHENLIFPIYPVFEGTCTANNGVTFSAGYFNVGQQAAVSKHIPLHLRPFAQDLANLASETPTSDPKNILFRSSIGFEKNPWCVGYVGVSATTTPKIPFTPLGAVTMKARAYAKPFGGRIGPWYGKTWPSGANESLAPSKNEQTEPVMTIRVRSDLQIPSLNPGAWRGVINLLVNHSRYLGDTIGIVSKLTMAHFAQAIHRMGKGGSKIKVGWWNHTVDPAQTFDSKNTNGDSLAWDQQTNSSPPMRDVEIAAVAPDQFDVATYSIDPDFYNNYLTKIQKGYEREFNFALRGDLGSRMQGSDAEKRFSIRNQIDSFKDLNKNTVDIQSKLTYYVNQFGQLLTAWQQKTPDAYVLDDTRFGKCIDEVGQADDPKWFTIGSCKAGGRVGYSVKIVDGQYLNNKPGGYELGGPGTSGNILNPPPSDF